MSLIEERKPLIIPVSKYKGFLYSIGNLRFIKQKRTNCKCYEALTDDEKIKKLVMIDTYTIKTMQENRRKMEYKFAMIVTYPSR